MKVKISFEIDYDNPKDIYEHTVLLDEIRNYLENEIQIPQTNNIFWRELSQIKITDDYKSPEKE